MKMIWSGLESSGKSLRLAQKIEYLIQRNAKWYTITGIPRPIRSNLRLAPEIEQWAHDLGVPVLYWKNLEELVYFYDCDVIIDEVGNYFDSRKWADLSLDVKKWLTQGAKSGIEIYGTAQDFAQVDKAFRRLTSHLYHVTKLFGSERPTPTKPPITRIWGVCMLQTLDPRAYKEDAQKFDVHGFPSFFFIERKYCMMYDTRQSIEVSELPPFRHEVRKCEHDGCGFVKIIHN